MTCTAKFGVQFAWSSALAPSACIREWQTLPCDHLAPTTIENLTHGLDSCTLALRQVGQFNGQGCPGHFCRSELGWA